MKKEKVSNVPPTISSPVNIRAKELPPLMNSSVSNLRKINPGFSYRLFDDNDCRNFIIEHFDR